MDEIQVWRYSSSEQGWREEEIRDEIRVYRGIVAQSKDGRRRGLEMKYKYRYRGTAVQCKDGGRRLEIKYRSIEVS